MTSNYEIAYEQFQLNTTEVKESTEAISEVKLETKGKILVVSGTNFEINYNKEKGELSNYLFNGNELIEKEPFESCADRQHAAKVGVYKGTISEQYFPYIRPQETGNKNHVRWVKLASKDGSGLQIYGKKKLFVSALNFNREDLDSGKEKTQKHAGELTQRKEVYVIIYGCQQGLGGITSWGTLPLEQYRLPYKSYSYSYWIVPLRE